MTRRILSAATGSTYAITLIIPDLHPAGVQSTRVELRNALDHLRRRDRRWHDFSMNIWLTSDGTLRGIATLGLLGLQDITETLGRRWPLTLRPINPTDFRVEIYQTLQRVWTGEPAGRRYQSLSLSIGPRRAVRKGTVNWSWADEAMPVVVG